ACDHHLPRAFRPDLVALGARQTVEEFQQLADVRPDEGIAHPAAMDADARSGKRVPSYGLAAASAFMALNPFTALRAQSSTRASKSARLLTLLRTPLVL